MPFSFGKKNNLLGPEETQEPTNSQQKKTKQEKIDAVQSIIPIKEIYRGMIITTDNRYVKILEVLPINFSLKSVEEQDNIIHLFAGWLRISPAKLQFKLVTRRADSSKIIENIKLKAEAEANNACRILTEDHIQFVRALSGQEALSRRFFLIFEYEATSLRVKSIDDVAADISETCRRIRNSLAQCGNEVLFHDGDDFFQAECLYLFYNRQSSGSEMLAERVMRVTADTMEMQGLKENVDPYPEIPVVDFIAPRGVDLTHKDFIICDGVYIAILYIPRNGYPNQVYGGWMGAVIEGSAGVDVDIILRRESRAEVRNKVALKLKLSRIKADSRSDTDTDYEEIEGAIEGASYIKKCLAGGEDLFHMYTFITVSAPTYEELLLQKEYVLDRLYANDVCATEIKYRLEDAFRVTAPLLESRQELMSFASRNVMTLGAASVFPFASCEICDEQGIVLGVNRRYSSVVNIDIFNTRKYKNANLAVLGTTGSGKTFCSLLMALRMRYQGIQTIIISPDKAHEMRRSCLEVGGSFIRISPGAKSCINIMEIRPVVNPIAEFLDSYTSSEQESWLANKTSQLLTFFHILIPDLTNEEEQLIDESIIMTYNKFGITNNNKSVYQHGTKKTKKMPIIGDLQATLQERESTRRVANILGRFVTGSAANFNGQTNVDLENKFIVFDLEELQGAMKAVGMFICMDFIWSRVKANRTEKKAIIIDEGWQLIGASSDARAAEFVYRIFKTIRGYGGSAIFATQDISDLFAFQGGKYGKAIISNSKIKIVLGLEQQEANCVKDVLQLTKNEVRNIVNFSRGEALICANNNKVPVYIRASRKEEELITTDPELLRHLVEEKKQLEFPTSLKNKSRTSEGRESNNLSEEADFSEEAHMSYLAMRQLQDNEVVRHPNGDIDTFEPDLPFIPVEGEEEQELLEKINDDLNRKCSMPSDEKPREESDRKERISYVEHPPTEF